jgi:bifunctional non-homologous end joining protein LigD
VAESSKLREYERKRDFGATSEPGSKPAAKARDDDAPRFVVQEHSATRLHWDLRLERDGVAASWAVPNGIPDDPAENHLAVHTEDHPLEYLEWEGRIPEGEYGAGTMRVYDHGTYELEKWESGKVILVFHGERVRGRYALFRTRGERDWMIHRMSPAERERDDFPESLEPMRGRAGSLPRKDGEWAAELRWPGERAIAYCRPGRLWLRDARGEVVTGRYPELRRLARTVGARDMVLDGVVVAFDGERSSSERLARRAEKVSDSTIRKRAKSEPVTYEICDLLYLEGRDLRNEPYRHRRELLENLGLPAERWQVPSYATADFKPLLEAVRAKGLPGLMLKRLDSRYLIGRESSNWKAV